MNDKKVMQMALETAEQIACADYRHWKELASLSEFERWARSRANHIAEALRTALAQPEKIECSRSHPHENMGSHCQLRTEIARLTNENAHLKAQPEPEPVAWVHNFIDDVITKNRPTDITLNAGRWTPLYTIPPQREWVGLTYKERCELWYISSKFSPESVIMQDFAKDIESRLRELNT